MNAYKVTAFTSTGEKVLDETIEATNDHVAKELATKVLEEKQLQESTYRCTSARGQLLLYRS